MGISLDKDKDKLTSFTQSKNMPWQQFFDGEMWQNKLARQYGVDAIPATYLLDGTGTEKIEAMKDICRKLPGALQRFANDHTNQAPADFGSQKIFKVKEMSWQESP